MISVPVLALCLSLLVTAPLAQKTPPRQCAKGVHIIGSRGHLAVPPYGGLNSTVAGIAYEIPGSTNYSVPFYTAPNSSYNFFAEATNGTGVFLQTLKSYVSSCPNTPIVLLGYSEGAVITMNGLCGASSFGFAHTGPLNSSYAPHSKSRQIPCVPRSLTLDPVIATVVYGDESRVAAGQPWNLGNCTANGTVARGVPGGVAACAAFAPNFQSYCDSGDPLCCNGNQAGVHKAYPGEYNLDVFAFVKQRYTSWLSAQPKTTTSSSAKPGKTAAP